MTTAVARSTRRRTSTYARIAWWSIALGLIMEALILLVHLTQSAALQPVSEGLGKVTWSLVVCLGLGFGKVISDDNPFWSGLAGLASAPAAFTLAEAIQKSVGEIVSARPGTEVLTPEVLTVAAIRGAEYLVLGVTLALVAQRGAGLRAYIATALAVGVVFGGIALLRTPATTASVAGMLGWTVNEVFFPLGCAAVLYAGESISGKLAEDSG